MKIKNYDVAKEQIRSHLTDYLSSQGITNLNNFNCINPQHVDSSPSCGVLKDQTHFHCLSCGVTGDIFDACHYLENKPNSGAGFITENLSYLAKKYEVAIEATSMSPEEILELDTYRAFAIADNIIGSTLFNQEHSVAVEKELKRRGWTSAVRSFGVGAVTSQDQVYNELVKHGFEEAFIAKIGLSNRFIFDTNKLIFTIKDENGRPVGFSARNLDWKEDGTEPKYNNVNSNNPIYHKGKRLFGLSDALPHLKNKPLYIMEGYGDVVTAKKNGLVNCCALGGTALTNDHVLLIRELGIQQVVLCLDGDKPGQDKVAKLLDTRLAGHNDISVKVVVIPEELDPDDYIRKYTIDKFNKLNPWSAFEWRLMRYPEDEDPDEVCEAMIKYIVNEPSYITQEKYCEILSKHTGVSLKAIESEVSRLQNERTRRISQERSVVIDRAIRAITTSSDDAEVVLNDALANLQTIAKKYDEDKLSEEACVKFLDENKTSEEAKSDEFGGFILGPDLAQLQEALCGEWKKDVLMVFGGKANSGKTSLLMKLAHEIAAHEENDACVIYHSIDDTAAQVLPKWVCVAEGSRQLSINQVRNPKYWQAQGYSDLLVRRAAGYESLRALMRTGRLIMKDANDGLTLAYAESLIKYYKEKYPNRNVVYILDNFHKLRDFSESEESERTRFKTMSNVIKNMAVKYHVPILCTMEYTKLPAGVKPTNSNIAETVQIEYDANLIAHLYNESHEMGVETAEAAGLTHNYMLHGQLNKLPVVELYIGKNKISDFKNRIFLDFFPASSDFLARDTASVEASIEAKKKEAQDNKPKNKKPSIFSN